jgi:adenylate kinase
MRIVFIGPPGAGKGTQCEQLLKYLGIPHFSTGQMLRDAIRRQTAVGAQVVKYMDAGQLVPDPIILEMVGQRIEQPDCRKGVLFDGFPRTVIQAEALDKSLALHGTPLDVVLNLRVSDDVVMRRLLERKRADDQPHIFAERLQTYRNLTQPVLDFYRSLKLLEVINGEQTPEAVAADIRQVVDRCRSA